jgi:hypothetical protein
MQRRPWNKEWPATTANATAAEAIRRFIEYLSKRDTPLPSRRLRRFAIRSLGDLKKNVETAAAAKARKVPVKYYAACCGG